MTATVSESQVWEALRGIPDPEFGINIVDLGLIYGVELRDDDTLCVVMTLTTPACPSGAWIYQGVKESLGQLVGRENLQVQMVFEPRWSTDMLSDSALKQLGRPA